MAQLVKQLPSPADTDGLAQAIAPYLVPGDCILLEGDLGAGKSQFARALIRALGTKTQHQPSPTFTLLQVYDDTRLPLAHADLYRIAEPEEVFDLHLEPFLRHGVTLVEWPQKAPAGFFPAEALTISLVEDSATGRTATLTGDSSWAKRFAFFAPEVRRESSEKGRMGYIQSLCNRKGLMITPVSQDASFRSYWRVRLEEGSRILMDAPPPLEDVTRFALVDRCLEGIGIHTPHIYNMDATGGYALLEDFGDTTFYGAIQNGMAPQPLYEAAVDVLLKIYKGGEQPVGKYTAAMYLNEASLFVDWYMPMVNGRATHTADRRAFRDIWLPLVEKMLTAPKSTVLFDYHCQNLMLVGGGLNDIGNVGVLDFQDARTGPVVHDLASLLYDVRYDVPRELHDILIRRMVDGLEGAMTLEAFTEAMKLSALQNLTRIAGVFTRLAYRDGKRNYLNYMPRLWRYFDELVAMPACLELRRYVEKNTPVSRELSA